MKTKIIIDCSAIFYQVINRIVGYNGKNIKPIVDSGRKYLTLESEQLSFLQDMHDEFNGLNNYSSILGTDGIYFAFDTLNEKSFRFHLHPEYKQSKSRQKEVVFDKTIFKSLIKKYHDELLDKGFRVIEYTGLEADDIFLEFKNTVHEDYNIGIITVDSDINQLLDHRTFIYHPLSYETFITKDFRMGGNVATSKPSGDGSDFDYFFGSTVEQEQQNQGYEKFFSNKKIIDPKLDLFKKIIIGDDMDNIPTFFRYKTKSGTSEFGFTKDRYKQLFEKYQDELSLELLYDDEKFPELLQKFSAIVGRDLDPTRIDEYKSKRNFNRAMIDLNESSKHHKSSPEIVGIIMDQLRKPEVHFGVVSFYENDTQTY